MKKQFILGMSLAMLVSSAMAAGGTRMTGIDVDSRLSKKMESANKAGALTGVDYSTAAKKHESTAKLLGKNNSGLDVDALARAQSTVLTVTINGEVKRVSVEELAVKTQMVNQEIAATKEARVELDQAAKDKMSAREKGVALNAQVLAMSATTATGVKPGSARTAEMIQKDSAGHDKFVVEFTNVLETGSVKEIEAYNKLAQAMVDAKTSDSVTKDEAYDKAMTAVYGKNADAKKKDLEGCKRG